MSSLDRDLIFVNDSTDAYYPVLEGGPWGFANLLLISRNESSGLDNASRQATSPAVGTNDRGSEYCSTSRQRSASTTSMSTPRTLRPRDLGGAPRPQQMTFRMEGSRTDGSNNCDVSRICDLANQFMWDARPHLAGIIAVHIEIIRQIVPRTAACETSFESKPYPIHTTVELHSSLGVPGSSTSFSATGTRDLQHTQVSIWDRSTQISSLVHAVSSPSTPRPPHLPPPETTYMHPPHQNFQPPEHSLLTPPLPELDSAWNDTSFMDINSIDMDFSDPKLFDTWNDMQFQ